MQQDNPTSVFDFTYHWSYPTGKDEQSSLDSEVSSIRKLLKPHCKKYGFQLEKGKNMD